MYVVERCLTKNSIKAPKRAKSERGETVVEEQTEDTMSKTATKKSSKNANGRAKRRISPSTATKAAAPNADVNAEIIRTSKVTGKRVVIAKNAVYRGAVFSGALLLAEDVKPETWENGDLRARVKLDWYDWSTTTGYVAVMFKRGQYTIKEKYRGSVVAGLGRKE